MFPLKFLQTRNTDKNYTCTINYELEIGNIGKPYQHYTKLSVIAGSIIHGLFTSERTIVLFVSAEINVYLNDVDPVDVNVVFELLLHYYDFQKSVF